MFVLTCSPTRTNPSGVFFHAAVWGDTRRCLRKGLSNALWSNWRDFAPTLAAAAENARRAPAPHRAASHAMFVTSATTPEALTGKPRGSRTATRGSLLTNTASISPPKGAR